MAKVTPMMEQYFEIKNKYRHCLLFFRLGDFYELFFEDAVIGSRELGLTLTGKDWGQSERAPMCGVPFHSADGYIDKLVQNGYKVAICEQVEDPKEAKGIVKRDVIRVVTPGTVIDNEVLDENKNNYIEKSNNDSGRFIEFFVFPHEKEADWETAEQQHQHNKPNLGIEWFLYRHGDGGIVHRYSVNTCLVSRRFRYCFRRFPTVWTEFSIKFCPAFSTKHFHYLPTF